jgi:transcription elongation factor Elf1
MVVYVGRRRRKIVKKKIIKPPPKIFLCPICSVEAVTVLHQKGEEYAEVFCANCKTKVKIRWYPAYSEVDAYSEFYDIVTGKKKIEIAAEAPTPNQENTLSIEEESVHTPDYNNLEETEEEQFNNES